ncbi:MAG: hypothetical protein O8C58_00820 [Candidatus Methanoperedens sp.]|nr:hypothetical protein [Candidatus Methanoperedens sp.]
MTELATWKTFPLKVWRKKNGFTTPEWESYVKAINIQDTIFSFTLFVSGVIIGFYGKI